jgi:hypothetical protein
VLSLVLIPIKTITYISLIYLPNLKLFFTRQKIIIRIFNSHKLHAQRLPIIEIIVHSQYVQLDTFGYLIKVFKANVLQQKHNLLFFT